MAVLRALYLSEWIHGAGNFCVRWHFFCALHLDEWPFSTGLVQVSGVRVFVAARMGFSASWRFSTSLRVTQGSCITWGSNAFSGQHGLPGRLPSSPAILCCAFQSVAPSFTMGVTLHHFRIGHRHGSMVSRREACGGCCGRILFERFHGCPAAVLQLSSVTMDLAWASNVKLA